MMIESTLVRIKPAVRKILLPTLVLTGTVFGLAFFTEKIEKEYLNTVFIVAAVFLAVFWFFPLMSYLLGYLELTSKKIVLRSGFLGLRKRTLNLDELASLEIIRPKAMRPKVLLIHRVDESTLKIAGYSKLKFVAAEIERLAKRTLV